jgi:hypothetical protein
MRVLGADRELGCRRDERQSPDRCDCHGFSALICALAEGSTRLPGGPGQLVSGPVQHRLGLGDYPEGDWLTEFTLIGGPSLTMATRTLALKQGAGRNRRLATRPRRKDNPVKLIALEEAFWYDELSTDGTPDALIPVKPEVIAGPDSAGFEAGDRVGGVVFEDANAELVPADSRPVSHALTTVRDSLTEVHIDCAARHHRAARPGQASAAEAHRLGRGSGGRGVTCRDRAAVSQSSGQPPASRPTGGLDGGQAARRHYPCHHPRAARSGWTTRHPPR